MARLEGRCSIQLSYELTREGSVMSRSPQDKRIGAPLGGRFSNFHGAAQRHRTPLPLVLSNVHELATCQDSREGLQPKSKAEMESKSPAASQIRGYHRVHWCQRLPHSGPGA